MERRGEDGEVKRRDKGKGRRHGERQAKKFPNVPQLTGRVATLFTHTHTHTPSFQLLHFILLLPECLCGIHTLGLLVYDLLLLAHKLAAQFIYLK